MEIILNIRPLSQLHIYMHKANQEGTPRVPAQVAAPFHSDVQACKRTLGFEVTFFVFFNINPSVIFTNISVSNSSSVDIDLPLYCYILIIMIILTITDYV